MAQNISTYFNAPITLVAGATAFVDVNMKSVGQARVIAQQTWASTQATTGLTINIYDGFGGNDPNQTSYAPAPVPYAVYIAPSGGTVGHGASTNVVWSNNYIPVTQPNGTTGLVQPKPSSGVTQTTNTAFYLNNVITTYPGWVGFQVVNMDSSNSCIFQLLADI